MALPVFDAHTRVKPTGATDRLRGAHTATGSGLALLVAVWSGSGSQDSVLGVLSVTLDPDGDAIPLTHLATEEADAASQNQGRVSFYALDGEAPAGAFEVEVIYDASSATPKAMSILTYSGANIADPFTAGVAAVGPGTAPSIAIPTDNPDQLAVGALVYINQTNPLTPVDANQVDRVTDTHTPNNQNIVTELAAGEGASTTIGWTGGQNRGWAMVGVAINGASGGGGGDTIAPGAIPSAAHVGQPTIQEGGQPTVIIPEAIPSATVVGEPTIPSLPEFHLFGNIVRGGVPEVGVKVWAIDMVTDTVHTATTDANGDYDILDLVEGREYLVVTAHLIGGTQYRAMPVPYAVPDLVA